MAWSSRHTLKILLVLIWEKLYYAIGLEILVPHVILPLCLCVLACNQAPQLFLKHLKQSFIIFLGF